MIKKKVAITLFIVALLLVAVVITNCLIQSDEKISTNDSQDNLNDTGNGKIGVVILPPEIEDKNNVN
jgi:hypothetical protein